MRSSSRQAAVLAAFLLIALSACGTSESDGTGSASGGTGGIGAGGGQGGSQAGGQGGSTPSGVPPGGDIPQPKRLATCAPRFLEPGELCPGALECPFSAGISLGCSANVPLQPSIDFVATGPDDVYFVATAEGWTSEAYLRVPKVFFIERHADVIDMTDGPASADTCLIALDDDAPVLACTTIGGGLLYASRGDSAEFEIEAIDVAPYTSSLHGFQVSDDGTTHLLLGRHATGAAVETALVLRSRPRGGDWSEEVLWEHDFDRAEFAFDTDGEPTWAAWATATTGSDLWAGRSGEDPRVVAQGVERTGGPVFALLGDATEPQLVASVETPTLYPSPDSSETEAELSLVPDAASYSTTCPTLDTSNCSGAAGTCDEKGDRYGGLGFSSLEHEGAIAVYTHELIDRDYALLGCNGRNVTSERGEVELVLTRAPLAAGDTQPEVLLTRPFPSNPFNLGYDQDLKAAATGDVIHVFDGIDYLVVDTGTL